jgi:Zn-dependent peptidase ImmA (M78 family)
MAAANPMTALYEKLAAFGLPRAWVKKTLLPSWWDDEAARTPAGYAEALLHVARTAGLDLSSLGSGEQAVASPAPVRFKRRSDSDRAALEVARALATQLARTVAAAAPPQGVVPSSALELREKLLDDRSWIDLETLVSYCWSAGIPVLRTTNFPRGAAKPDALAVDVGGRRVIVITSAHTSAPWLLFFVAHELGHIACGHLAKDSALVDASVSRDDLDREEVEANEWAVTLLSGKPDERIYATASWPTADRLAQAAQQLAVQLQTDPGFIVLNYAHSMGPTFYAVANSALRFIPGAARGDATLLRLANEKLDWSMLGEDAAEFASRMLRIDDVPPAP